MSISISLELAEYLLERHLDCVIDDTGFEVPENIKPKIDKLYKSVGREKNRQRVRAKVASLPNTARTQTSDGQT